MSRDLTFHIVADTDPIIRQLRQLHHELNTLRRAHRRPARRLDRDIQRNRGPQPGCGWRHRKGQAHR